jgi:hypothetical protein
VRVTPVSPKVVEERLPVPDIIESTGFYSTSRQIKRIDFVVIENIFYLINDK